MVPYNTRRFGSCHLLSCCCHGIVQSQWVTAVNRFSVQMLKYLNIWIFQTSAKSLPNLEICDFFCQNLEKKSICPDRLFFVQILFLLRSPPNFQIFKYIAYMFIHESTYPDNPSVDVIFPWTFVRESESRNANCVISLVQFSPKYPSTL
jgi:hypothetical protein